MRIYLTKFSLHTTLHLIWSITLNVVDPVLFNNDQLVSPSPPCPQITQIVLLFQQNHNLLPHSEEDGTRVHLSEPHAIYWARHGTSGRIPDATRPFCISACRRKYPRTAITHTSPQIQIHRQTQTHSHICIQIQIPYKAAASQKKACVVML